MLFSVFCFTLSYFRYLIYFSRNYSAIAHVDCAYKALHSQYLFATSVFNSKIEWTTKIKWMLCLNYLHVNEMFGILFFSSQYEFHTLNCLLLPLWTVFFFLFWTISIRVNMDAIVIPLFHSFFLCLCDEGMKINICDAFSSSLQSVIEFVFKNYICFCKNDVELARDACVLFRLFGWYSIYFSVTILRVFCMMVGIFLVFSLQHVWLHGILPQGSVSLWPNIPPRQPLWFLTLISLLPIMTRTFPNLEHVDHFWYLVKKNKNGFKLFVITFVHWIWFS